ncbi:MAG: putative toxin-antitoxin system toxin component, PIN family [Clostridia bacterium]|nr:putative toxin-antitoxin system toxin component, PIN family [Clostridia bacterium]
MKIVIDTNVFVKAIFHNDKWCQKVLENVQNGLVTYYLNDAIDTEINFIFMFHAIEIGKTLREIIGPHNRLHRLLWKAEKVFHVTKSSLCVDDEDDNKFIDCAVDSKANYIITQDGSHLFGLEESIKKEYGIALKILSPYQFMIEFNANKYNKKISIKK